MRDLLDLERFAIRLPGAPPNCSVGGCFEIASPATGAVLRVIASAGMGWDHVSVSTKKRCSNWHEMARVKDLFFYEHECAMQLHVPVEDHVNNHPHCLHLWRPHDIEIPRPPALLVGIPGLGPEQVRRLSPGERDRLRDAAYGVLTAEQREAAE